MLCVFLLLVLFFSVVVDFLLFLPAALTAQTQCHCQGKKQKSNKQTNNTIQYNKISNQTGKTTTTTMWTFTKVVFCFFCFLCYCCCTLCGKCNKKKHSNNNNNCKQNTKKTTDTIQSNRELLRKLVRLQWRTKQNCNYFILSCEHNIKNYRFMIKFLILLKRNLWTITYFQKKKIVSFHQSYVMLYPTIIVIANILSKN